VDDYSPLRVRLLFGPIDVCFESRLRENADALNRDRTAYSPKTALGTLIASPLSLVFELKNIILVALRDFAFSHSLSHERTFGHIEVGPFIPPIADIQRLLRHVRFVPILLQNSRKAQRLISRQRTKRATIADQ
jgi:hypothetical protein